MIGPKDAEGMSPWAESHAATTSRRRRHHLGPLGRSAFLRFRSPVRCRWMPPDRAAVIRGTVNV